MAWRRLPYCSRFRVPLRSPRAARSMDCCRPAPAMSLRERQSPRRRLAPDPVAVRRCSRPASGCQRTRESSPRHRWRAFRRRAPRRRTTARESESEERSATWCSMMALAGRGSQRTSGTLWSDGPWRRDAVCLSDPDPVRRARSPLGSRAAIVHGFAASEVCVAQRAASRERGVAPARAGAEGHEASARAGPNLTSTDRR